MTKRNIATCRDAGRFRLLRHDVCKELTLQGAVNWAAQFDQTTLDARSNGEHT